MRAPAHPGRLQPGQDRPAGQLLHGNPEDPAELGRLVECVKAIARAADAYNAPFISGKDSFYNYFETEDGPINVPVTFLCSGFGVVESPDHVIGSSLRRNDSLLYLIGHTEDEMGGSVFARTHGVEDGKVPQTDCAANMELYKAYYNALTSGWCSPPTTSPRRPGRHGGGNGLLRQGRRTAGPHEGADRQRMEIPGSPPVQ